MFSVFAKIKPFEPPFLRRILLRLVSSKNLSQYFLGWILCMDWPVLAADFQGLKWISNAIYHSSIVITLCYQAKMASDTKAIGYIYLFCFWLLGLRHTLYILWYICIVKPLAWRPQLCHRLVYVFAINPQLLIQSRFKIINYIKRLLAGFKVENLFYFLLEKKRISLVVYQAALKSSWKWMKFHPRTKKGHLPPGKARYRSVPALWYLRKSPIHNTSVGV